MPRPTIQSVNARIESHEAVCAERMGEILARVKRLEAAIVTSAGAIILLLISLMFKGG
jgi:predicted nucleic acid-binding Zn ribbon protein|tara:strand:- start:1141 stop:1314 length:174 start_codon:yes stop_codon:yes gene_type:complete